MRCSDLADSADRADWRTEENRASRVQSFTLCVRQRRYRRQRQPSELDLRTLRLQGDPAGIRCRVEAVVHQIAVHPHPDRAADRLDHHGVPLAERLLRAIGQVDDPTSLPLGDPPVRRRPPAALHVRNFDVLHDTPEIAGVSVFHLHLDRLRKHRVERARSGRMHQHTGVAGRGRKAILDLEAIVAVAGIADEMTARLAEADEHTVAHDERRMEPRVGVGRGDVGMPTGEIEPVEQTQRFHASRCAAGGELDDARGSDQEASHGGQ